MQGVYLIPYSCGTPKIGEAGQFINQSVQENAGDIRHYRAQSSALAEHDGKMKHHISLEESQVIVMVDHFHHRKFKEAIEIEKTFHSLNRDDMWKTSSCSIPYLFS